MAEDPIAESVRRIYQKDLYDDHFSLNVRIDSDGFEHGDMVRVTVEKLEKSPDRATEAESDSAEEES